MLHTTCFVWTWMHGFINILFAFQWRHKAKHSQVFSLKVRLCLYAARGVVPYQTLDGDVRFSVVSIWEQPRKVAVCVIVTFWRGNEITWTEMILSWMNRAQQNVSGRNAVFPIGPMPSNNAMTSVKRCPIWEMETLGESSGKGNV